MTLTNILFSFAFAEFVQVLCNEGSNTSGSKSGKKLNKKKCKDRKSRATTTGGDNQKCKENDKEGVGHRSHIEEVYVLSTSFISGPLSKTQRNLVNSSEIMLRNKQW